MAEIEALKGENNDLENTSAGLQKEAARFSLNQDFAAETIEDLNADIEGLKQASGYTEITLNGILVKLNDNAEAADKARAEGSTLYDAENFIIHDKTFSILSMR